MPGRGDAGPPARVTTPDARTEDDVRDRGSLVCAVCARRITDEAYRIERGGAHDHTFVNPAGVVHRVACFATATGCSYLSAAETAFSWFPGHRWQIATCGGCGAHLGWIFRGEAGESFHGLVADALRPG